MELRRRMTLLVAGALTALPGIGWTASPGKLDPYDVPGYLRRLERSRTPLARTIRRKIQDGPSDLARQREAARQEGIPVSAQELRIPTPPPALNAAPIYRRLIRVLEARPLSNRSETLIREMGSRCELTPQESGRVRDVLVKRRDVMELVHQAADRPRCVFARDWSLGPKLIFHEYAGMRRAVLLLRAESYLQARQGHYTEAIVNQARGLRVAEHTAEPILIGYIVATALARDSLEGMGNILHQAGPNAEVAERVRQTINSQRPRVDLRQVLHGEVASNAVAMRMLRSSGPALLAEWQSIWEHLGNSKKIRQLRSKVRKLGLKERRTWIKMIDAAEAEYLHMMRRVNACLDRPHALRVTSLRQLDASMSDSSSVSHMFLEGIFDLSFVRLDSLHVRQRALEEVTMAGAALLAYKARQGSFPERLEQALPEAPLDPFSGQPLKYRREESGFVVYSVGPEGNFDGNEPRSYRPSDQALFRYPALPPVRPPWLDPPVQ